MHSGGGDADLVVHAALDKEKMPSSSVYFDERTLTERLMGWLPPRLAAHLLPERYLQGVRYVIHTITFCAVFGNEKLIFQVENCIFISKIAFFSRIFPPSPKKRNHP